MTRRLLLVGIFVIVNPGSIEQLAYATITSVLFLTIQTTASPYRTGSNNLMAAVCSLAIVLLFLISILCKCNALMQVWNCLLVLLRVVNLLHVLPCYTCMPTICTLWCVQQVDNTQAVIGFDYHRFYVLVWAASISTLAILAGTITKLATHEAVKARREARMATARRLHHLNSNTEVIIHDKFQSLEVLIRRLHPSHRRSLDERILPQAGPFHVFLRCCSKR